MMLVPEEIMAEIIAGVPPIIKDGRTFPIRYEWGAKEDFDLYLSTAEKPLYPIVWMEQDKHDGNNVQRTRQTKLLIAINSNNPQARNPHVWRTEFREILTPLTEKVIKAIERSGICFIERDRYSVYYEANYPTRASYTTTEVGSEAADIWNVVVLEMTLVFTGATICVQKPNY